MTATLMKGKPLADRIRAEVAEQLKRIGHVGLVTVLVGDDPASEVYIRLKHKAAVEAGFDATDLRLPAETTQDDLLAKLDELNRSEDVDAILVQLPLPQPIHEADVLVAAVGVPALVAADMVKERSVVVDVGMNRTEAGLVGDVDPGALDVAAYMTPVPGGVGPMTIACLLQNAVLCGRY